MDKPRDTFDFLQEMGRDWQLASYAGAEEELRLQEARDQQDLPSQSSDPQVTLKRGSLAQR